MNGFLYFLKINWIFRYLRVLRLSTITTIRLSQKGQTLEYISSRVLSGCWHIASFFFKRQRHRSFSFVRQIIILYFLSIVLFVKRRRTYSQTGLFFCLKMRTVKHAIVECWYKLSAFAKLTNADRVAVGVAFSYIISLLEQKIGQRWEVINEFRWSRVKKYKIRFHFLAKMTFHQRF